MWTTLSSRVEAIGRRGIAFAFGAAIAGCAGHLAPDAPRPAAPELAAGPPHEDSAAYRGTVELVAVRVRKLDPAMERMAGAAYLREAREPLAIEVHTRNPLPRTPRSTSAVLFLNGKRLDNTWAILPDRLVAFISDRSGLRESNTVTAAWLGAETTSLTRSPLVFRAEDVGR